MNKDPTGRLHFSPTDLCLFFQCPFSSWMNRYDLEFPGQYSKDADDETSEMFKKKGIEFEAQFLQKLKSEGKIVCELKYERSIEARNRSTRDALSSGADIIYQAYLSLGDFGGYADFLSRTGDKVYEVWDTKLSKKPKPYFLIQLCCYAEMLEDIQGVKPEFVQVVLGTGEARRFETEKYFGFYAHLKRKFLEQQQTFDPNKFPTPPLEVYGPWQDFATRWYEERNHVGLVATISRSQVTTLVAQGIETIDQLASSRTPLVPERLVSQARLQCESRGKDCPVFELAPRSPGLGLELLPPQDPGDVFFDLEGYPMLDGGLEYLFGVTYREGGKLAFCDWWAHDRPEEKKTFENFVDWVGERRKKYPNMHVYHYGHYEKAALRRLMGRHGTREDEIDDFLRSGTLVDLYAVVRQALVIGEPRYSLKNVEKIFNPGARSGDVTRAMDSVVSYHRWLEADRTEEGPTWETSKILKDIRDYNQVDCDSTAHLTEWLWELQSKNGISWIGSEGEARVDQDDEEMAREERGVLSTERLALRRKLENDSRQPVGALLSQLLEFHRREEKPFFWRMFDRHKQSEEELATDTDCLVGLVRTESAPKSYKKSQLFEYRYNPNPDSPIRAGSQVLCIHDLSLKLEVHELDEKQGLIWLKFGPTQTPPERLSLMPYDYVPSQALQAGVRRYVDAWMEQSPISQAMERFLKREPPTFKKKVPLTQLEDAVLNLDESVLCIQGPPGTGKTFTASQLIMSCLKAGRTVGITSLSHAAIDHLVGHVTERLREAGIKIGVAKIQREKGKLAAWYFKSMGDVAAVVGKKFFLVGGTAWPFASEAAEGKFDYLFVDEAGQVPLASLVAMAESAKNIVLMGDPMQLSQPTQGTHPGDSGKSALQYYLEPHSTIPPDRGVFLETTFRMHPDVCREISRNFYESRLVSADETKGYSLILSQNPLLSKSTGVVHVPVQHEGCVRSSIEEVQMVRKLVEFLEQKVPSHEILVVSPYNLQVNLLKDSLGEKIKVGTVDKFQGQEGTVVILSMATSDLSLAPRGAEFLLNKNRLNVAISRARSLAIIVSNPNLIGSSCQTIEQMELLSLFCQITEKR